MWHGNSPKTEQGRHRRSKSKTINRKFMVKYSLNVPEAALCFIEIDFNIFAVCYTELYKNRVPPVVPLGSCWMPVMKQKEDKKTCMLQK